MQRLYLRFRKQGNGSEWFHGESVHLPWDLSDLRNVEGHVLRRRDNNMLLLQGV